jgi:hypothetical protein
MSYVFSRGLVSACAVRRTTTESSHHQDKSENMSQPGNSNTYAHSGPLNGGTIITAVRITRQTTIIALRPKSQPRTDWHVGHGRFVRKASSHLPSPNHNHDHVAGSPQWGHFLLPRLYIGGLNHAMSTPPRVSGLYHVGHYWSISPTNHERSAMSYEL